MDILVTESASGAARAAAEHLEAAGHRVHRCHDTSASTFPCAGLTSECPLDAGAIDLVLTVRGHVRMTPAPAEDGRPDPFLRPVVGDVLDQAYWDTHSGIEFARGFVAGDHLPPVCHLTGLAWTACAEGSATCTLPRSPWLCNGFGILYGGAMALLADFAQNSALLTTLPAGTTYAPLDFKVNFLRPVLPDPSVLTAHARVVHMGRTIALTTCELVDDAGRRVALANETMVLLPGRPWSRSLPVGEEDLGRDGGTD